MSARVVHPGWAGFIILLSIMSAHAFDPSVSLESFFENHCSKCHDEDVKKGGHDVPDEKLEQRFERTLANLERAIESLPLVMVFDNSDLAKPHQLKAVYQDGERCV